MRFDERDINELKVIRSKLRILLLRRNDAGSEEHGFLRRLHILVDGAISLSKKELVEFSINSGELKKFMEKVEADGLSEDEVVEDLICKYNKRG